MNSYNECNELVELDLDPIKVKLMHKESGEGWSLEQASAVETEYRRFLYMMKVFPSEMLAPSEDIDTFWHYHILDTMKYARDCEKVFGYFLHHFPYVGMRGDDDLAALGQAGERMASLYEETFGEKYHWSLIRETIALQSNTAPAFCMQPQATAAFCMQPKAMTAFCMQPKPAFCMQPKSAVAFCMQPKAITAFGMKPSARAAYCTATGGKQDETGVRTDSGSIVFSKDPAQTVADGDILMNAFFSARPRLPAQAEAN